LIVLLFLAVGARVFSYGITESRYFLILLAFWLLFITIYSLVSPRQNIKLIPISLCILTVFCIYGPQSAFSIAEYSQVKILTGIFNRNNAFANQKLSAVNRLSVKDGNRAANTLSYIVDHYDYKALQPYVNKDLNHIADSLSKTLKPNKFNRYSLKSDLKNLKTNWLKNYLGLGKFNAKANENDNTENNLSEVVSYTLNNNQSGLTATTGYDYVLEESNFEQNKINNTSLRISMKEGMKEKGVLSLRLNNDSVSFNLKELLNLLLKNPSLEKYRDLNHTGRVYNLPDPMLNIGRETKNFRLVYKINLIRFDYDDHHTIKGITYTNGVFLIKRK